MRIGADSPIMAGFSSSFVVTASPAIELRDEPADDRGRDPAMRPLRGLPDDSTDRIWRMATEPVDSRAAAPWTGHKSTVLGHFLCHFYHAFWKPSPERP